MRTLAALFLVSLATAAGCVDAPDDVTASSDDPEQGGYEGVEQDETDPGAPMDDGKSDAPHYVIPTDLPDLVDPEVIVSLDGLTVHIFDRATGFQEIYPAGVGVKGSNGRSITPTGHFQTGADTTDSWWYVARRTNPDYFAGFPFLRLTAENSDGANTYALHGPITASLQRGYVSHGCVRMRGQDVVRVFWMAKHHASMNVTIQKEVELDAAGKKVDVGTHPALFPVTEDQKYGASVGPLHH